MWRCLSVKAHSDSLQDLETIKFSQNTQILKIGELKDTLKTFEDLKNKQKSVRSDVFDI